MSEPTREEKIASVRLWLDLHASTAPADAPNGVIKLVAWMLEEVDRLQGVAGEYRAEVERLNERIALSRKALGEVRPDDG